MGGFSTPGPRVVAVGRATARAAVEAGFDVVLVPPRHDAAGLLEALRSTGALSGARVLLPASSIGRTELAEGLEAMGARVERVVAYENRAAPLDVADCRADLAAGRVGVVTFASPSAVRSLDVAFGGEAARELDGRTIASIGPTTSAALRAAGFTSFAEARVSTLDGLVEAVVSAVGTASRRRHTP